MPKVCGLALSERFLYNIILQMDLSSINSKKQKMKPKINIHLEQPAN